MNTNPNRELEAAETAGANSSDQGTSAVARGNDRTLNSGTGGRRLKYNQKKKTGHPKVQHFKGETMKMNGNVFQVHSERKKIS